MLIFENYIQNSYEGLKLKTTTRDTISISNEWAPFIARRLRGIVGCQTGGPSWYSGVVIDVRLPKFLTKHGLFVENERHALGEPEEHGDAKKVGRPEHNGLPKEDSANAGYHGVPRVPAMERKETKSAPFEGGEGGR